MEDQLRGISVFETNHMARTGWNVSHGEYSIERITGAVSSQKSGSRADAGAHTPHVVSLLHREIG